MRKMACRTVAVPGASAKSFAGSKFNFAPPSAACCRQPTLSPACAHKPDTVFIEVHLRSHVSTPAWASARRM